MTERRGAKNPEKSPLEIATGQFNKELSHRPIDNNKTLEAFGQVEAALFASGKKPHDIFGMLEGLATTAVIASAEYGTQSKAFVVIADSMRLAKEQFGKTPRKEKSPQALSTSEPKK